jgi:hypothetical protein
MVIYLPEYNLMSHSMGDENTIQRHIRRCGRCGSTEHDRRTCNHPEEVERRSRRQNRIRVNRLSRQRLATESISLPLRHSYKIYNNNNYPVCLFWGKEGTSIIKYFHIVHEFVDTSIKATPTTKIIAIPSAEFNTPLSNGDEIDYLTTDKVIVGEFNLVEFENTEIHLIKEYKPSKTELEKWKECGLKSLFLLKEIERMGGKQYENLEPILDLVQDIPLPTHTELDREKAGVPSVFTNIT